MRAAGRDGEVSWWWWRKRRKAEREGELGNGCCEERIGDC